MSDVITRASREWISRPDDERYLTLEDLHRATRERAYRSEVRTVVNRSLLARGSEDSGGELTLQHEDLGVLAPTHWSLSQLATISHTPAKWLREIATVPAGPAFAAHAINLGLRLLAGRESVQVMSEDGERHSLRCLVGPDYGRIYDHEVVEAVRAVNSDDRWRVPASSQSGTNPKRATTLYASDRDVFIFLVDEENPVRVRVGEGVRHLFRGFMVWNSEVGHQRFGMMTFLYDFVCDNRMVWGAREVKELSITHRKNAPERFLREVTPMLRSYAESSVADVEAKLERAAKIRVGKTDDEVLSWLRSHEFTRPEAERIMESAKAEEGGARSAWELVNGGTAFARSIPYAGERVTFERRVSRLLSAV
jgi:hypothetical protein